MDTMRVECYATTGLFTGSTDEILPIKITDGDPSLDVSGECVWSDLIGQLCREYYFSV